MEGRKQSCGGPHHTGDVKDSLFPSPIFLIISSLTHGPFRNVLLGIQALGLSRCLPAVKVYVISKVNPEGSGDVRTTGYLSGSKET